MQIRNTQYEQHVDIQYMRLFTHVVPGIYRVSDVTPEN